MENTLETAPFHNDVADGPPSVKAYWLKTQDGLKIRAAHWKSEQQKNGTIFIFQGRSENLEKYGLLINALVAQNYDVFSLDWRGQGLSDRLHSDRMLGHVGSYIDYQLDVDAFVAAAGRLNLPKPWYLIAHSLGACVALRSLGENLSVTACAFTAPLWDINLPRAKRLAAWPLSWFVHKFNDGRYYAPGARAASYVLTTPFEGNRLTTNPSSYDYYIHVSAELPDQQVGGPSYGWLYQTLLENRRLSSIASPDVPCLTLLGKDDQIISLEAVDRRMNSWPLGQIKRFEGARHDVLYEASPIRDCAISEILNHFQTSSN